MAALDAGADDYVTKPFIMAELLARVRSAPPPGSTPRLREGGPGSVHLEDLEINLATRRLIVEQGARSRLRRQGSFDLLNFFLSNPNVPIPHKGFCKPSGGPITATRSNICGCL